MHDRRTGSLGTAFAVGCLRDKYRIIITCVLSARPRRTPAGLGHSGAFAVAFSDEVITTPPPHASCKALKCEPSIDDATLRPVPRLAPAAAPRPWRAFTREPHSPSAAATRLGGRPGTRLGHGVAAVRLQPLSRTRPMSWPASAAQEWLVARDRGYRPRLAVAGRSLPSSCNSGRTLKQPSLEFDTGIQLSGGQPRRAGDVGEPHVRGHPC